jgi:hypothetical protein
MEVMYEKPLIDDYGDLTQLTAGCNGLGGPDAGFQGDLEAFPDISPAFGDPANCG